MYCIETKSLVYRFSKNETVLNNINIQVPVGSVYGFLGPNGAGKTTTLKLILGLLRLQQGEVSILDKQIDQDRIAILAHVGSLIEAPSLYAHLNARENLRILQLVYNCPRSRVHEVLELVGLADTGDKKAGKFSLGMKQRLSIAMALLPSPSLLVLDEPTNGLDPKGIIEIRELLKRLNKDHKMTIMVSSHLLSEIEKLVTDVGIINKGQLLFQGKLNELMKKQQQSGCHVMDTSDNSKAMELLNSAGFNVYAEGDKIILPAADKDGMGRVNDLLILQGIKVYEMTTAKNDLESIFIDLIKN